MGKRPSVHPLAFHKHGTNIQQSVDSDHSQFDHEKDTVQLPSSKI
jgi:hypothetical protein